jgi:hypothetical protein
MHTASEEWAARVAARNEIETAKAKAAGGVGLSAWAGQAWQPSLFNAARVAAQNAEGKEAE